MTADEFHLAVVYGLALIAALMAARFFFSGQD